MIGYLLFAIATASQFSPLQEGTRQNAYGNFDINHIIGNGQSLSVGGQGSETISGLTSQPFQNLKLNLGNQESNWPIDASNSQLAFAPLTEPIHKLANGYPSAYPLNTYGVTPHAAMANTITNLQSGYVSFHSMTGENGQGMDVIKKGGSGHAFAAGVFEATAGKRLAGSKSFGVTAILMTHGETDSGNNNYESQLVQLLNDYKTDLKKITGQSTDFPMLINQQHSYGNSGGLPTSTRIEWEISKNHPQDFICTGPKYQYGYVDDGVHLHSQGYTLLGEKSAEVYYHAVIKGENWRPLEPTKITVLNNTYIQVDFHVPNPPLLFDTQLPAPTNSAWRNGHGFEVTYNNQQVTITSTGITNDGQGVIIQTGSNVSQSGLKIGYAATANGNHPNGGTFRWGQLKDSDNFAGYTTKQVQPNFAVSFEMNA